MPFPSEQVSPSSNTYRGLVRDYKHSKLPIEGNVKLWVFHQDKVPVHWSTSNFTCPVETSYSGLQPAYSSDLTPCYFSLDEEFA
ncbi:hypothetical protein AVEN_149221-1 [Araneus ventricosus]|uniref:Uncharacterized protein n=1 Tax=Araneus ventricosus TaxID=182803 RepID=A0A4Y2LQD9_ARAVE|nr:hypothetical protein AVEN_149221-1 [Araneus ventricosus]